MSKKRIFYFLIVLFFGLIFLVHSYFVTHYLTSVIYERVRDGLFALGALFLCLGYIYLAKHDKQRFLWYIILANFFIMIFTLHSLRLFFNGLICNGSLN